MTGRYRIKRIGWDVREITDGCTMPDGSPVEPYGIWDAELGCWVNEWGEPDAEYWATNRAVALMRRRDLSQR